MYQKTLVIVVLYHERIGNANEQATRKSIVGEKNPMSRRIAQYTKNEKFIRYWVGIITASRELGINQPNIVMCCRGKQKSAGGFIWRYADTEGGE